MIFSSLKFDLVGFKTCLKWFWSNLNNSKSLPNQTILHFSAQTALSSWSQPTHLPKPSNFLYTVYIHRRWTQYKRHSLNPTVTNKRITRWGNDKKYRTWRGAYRSRVMEMDARDMKVRRTAKEETWGAGGELGQRRRWWWSAYKRCFSAIENRIIAKTRISPSAAVEDWPE